MHGRVLATRRGQGWRGDPRDHLCRESQGPSTPCKVSFQVGTKRGPQANPASAGGPGSLLGGPENADTGGKSPHREVWGGSS